MCASTGNFTIIYLFHAQRTRLYQYFSLSLRIQFAGAAFAWLRNEVRSCLKDALTIRLAGEGSPSEGTADEAVDIVSVIETRLGEFEFTKQISVRTVNDQAGRRRAKEVARLLVPYLTVINDCLAKVVWCTHALLTSNSMIGYLPMSSFLTQS